jgi:hypothetical protein
MEAARDRDAIETVGGANRWPIARRHFCDRTRRRYLRLHSGRRRRIGRFRLFGGSALRL